MTKKHQRTADELRDFVVATLTTREAVCRNASLKHERSSKGRAWEQGRADAYKDFREYLLRLDLSAPNLSGQP
ncbi:hypothetical protein LB572_03155 [Mesorhizobium sp. BH1-1-5]|uniref:hypothetical protein n=1 Tax=Mesorhizobium sp. BH1-1-5 TaxID=2876661 RepID=UPI001CCCD180|nr:hypothetical protein [Mesorhizobium sp. BH1-1-5]MBZ9986091.1 hypothetical protein [Mesorhizobium sp. BH1-1-5]